MKTEKIEIEVPEGKTAKWIDGVLKLVGEETKDACPVTERIKTFEDACDELGEGHALVEQWVGFSNSIMATMDEIGRDIVAYMKLRIICAALNEGWKPQFTKNENRYYPWFRIYNKEEIDNMDEDKRKNLVLLDGVASYGANAGFGFAYSRSVPSAANAFVGSRLCLKNSELATYCGKQFIDIWDYFVLTKK